MSNSYLLIIKSRQLMSMSISKIVLFNDPKLAYEYGINVMYNKEKVNTLEKALETNLVWTSPKTTFPICECKIITIDNDILCNIYQTLPNNEKILLHIYKELVLNEIINE